MKINQFSIAPTTPKQRQQELTMIHLLKKDNDLSLAPTALFETLLVRLQMGCDSPLTAKQWLHDLLATPTQALDEWLAAGQELTTEVFYRVAFQLLEFEPGVDFNINTPLASWHQLNLPGESHDQWTSTDVLDAFYLLLNTRAKNGQNLIDLLTARGFFRWTYQLPASEKPLFFNGKPLASFAPDHFIREVVYIETDMDTDYDGQADLVKAEIIRPKESDQGLRVPALFTASPYNQGTNDEWGDKATHDVNHPLTHKDPDYTAPHEPAFPTSFNHREIKGEVRTATQTFDSTPAYTLNNYLAVRGYAVVYSAGIGTKDADGFQTCGSPEQTASMQAVVEWLHGDRRAFTDRDSGLEIKARWCNGNVAMTGRSYLGTLATAVATTGVPGLKAIISEAAISSWYDYYRENGLVRAAGGFQGEDADTLADETFSRTKRPADFQRVKDTYYRYIAQFAQAMDRKTGNYNDFWDQRNYLKQADNIKADVLMVHGLNDTNVKPSNVKALAEKLAALPNTSKLILHQGQHIYINAFRSLDFSEMVNLWLANKLWERDNDADNVLPNVLVQDNVKPETWTAYDKWTDGQQLTLHLTPGRLTSGAAGTDTILKFDDHHEEAVFEEWCHHPAEWQQALIDDNGQQFSCHFKGLPLAESIILRGTPRLRVEVAASADHGLLSAELVDFGPAKRLTTNPVIFNRGGLPLGYHWKNDDLREFQLEKKVSNYRVISYGHINLQNRHSPAEVDDLQAGQFVTLDFALQPIFHQLAKGHQLGLLIYATDFAFTLRGNEEIKYQVKLNNAKLTIPATSKVKQKHN